MEKNKIFIEKTIEWFTNYLRENNIKNIIIGISGGIDSAVSLSILKKIDDINIFAYFIDIESSKESLDDAKLVAKFLDQKLDVIDLTQTYNFLVNQFNAKTIVQKGNIKSRLRMMFLYDKAHENNGLVVGNSNYDEIYLGYFTKFGDQASDIMLLNNLLKEEIFELAKYLSLPASIIDKKPSADLYQNQTDEVEIGFSYQDLDKYLKEENVPIEVSDKIKKIHSKNLHKQKIILNPNKIKKDCL